MWDSLFGLYICANKSGIYSVLKQVLGVHYDVFETLAIDGKTVTYSPACLLSFVGTIRLTLFAL